MVKFIRDMPRWGVLVVALVAIAAQVVTTALIGDRTFALGDEDQGSFAVTVEPLAAIVVPIIGAVIAIRSFGRRKRGVRLSGPYPRSTRELE